MKINKKGGIVDSITLQGWLTIAAIVLVVGIITLKVLLPIFQSSIRGAFNSWGFG